jgi:DNA polymerase I-like protein with 3'-5' exonuclease and polymerase domains
MLTIWTDQYDKKVLDQTIGAGLKDLPDVPEHRMLALKDELYLPQVGEVVLACGKKALQLLQAHKLVPKNRGLESQRGNAIQASAEGGKYLITVDPYLINSDANIGFEIGWDIRLAWRLLKHGHTRAILGNYRWVPDFSDAINCIKAKFAQTGKPVSISMDTESMGLYPWYPDKHLLTVQVTHTVGMADVYKVPAGGQFHPEVAQQISWLLNSPMVKTRGANFKHDLLWFWVKLSLECSNFSLDTTLAGSLLNENRSNSLNTHVKWYDPELGGYDDDLNNKHDKGHMELVPDDELLPYAGGDTDGDLRVSNHMIKELGQDQQLFKFYITIRHPSARAFEKIERRGVVFDVEKATKLGEELQATSKELNREALDLLPARLKMKYMDNLSLTRPAILRDYFFTPLGLNLKPRVYTASVENPQPSTAKSHLQMFADDPAAKRMCEVMTEMRSCDKMNSTYVVGFLSHLRPDGLLHPTYFLFKGEAYENDDGDDDAGVVTSRLSCRDPAFQTIPKRSKWAKKIRACYPAPPGYVMWAVDYSQGELKIAACLANEKTMIQVYLDGFDLHSKTASGIAGMSVEDFLALEQSNNLLFTQYRTAGKAGNFGLIYGMGAEGYQVYCWAQFGVKKTIEECENERNAFFATYPELLPWHANYKHMAHQNGHVRSPLGVARHLPLIHSRNGYERSKAERMAVNSPVQATLSNALEWSIVRVDQEIPEDDAFVVGMVHDQMIGYAKADKVDSIVPQIMELCETLPFEKEFGWKPQLKFTVDAEIGPDMASLKKVPRPEFLLAA